MERMQSYVAKLVKYLSCRSCIARSFFTRHPKRWPAPHYLKGGVLKIPFSAACPQGSTSLQAFSSTCPCWQSLRLLFLTAKQVGCEHCFGWIPSSLAAACWRLSYSTGSFRSSEPFWRPPLVFLWLSIVGHRRASTLERIWVLPGWLTAWLSCLPRLQSRSRWRVSLLLPLLLHHSNYHLGRSQFSSSPSAWVVRILAFSLRF